MDIEHLRKFCLSLPHVTEDVKWGHDLCFSVGDKMFCVGVLDGTFSVSFKVKDEEFDELSSSSDIIPAPYVARYKWVLVQKPDRLSKKEWEHYIRQSYNLVRSKLPTKVLNQLNNLPKR
jgi:predicted DNA-binding protein (MmcQ/YjbR family)